MIFIMNWFKRQKDGAKRCLPEHIGIIMDGNGRWAKKRGLPRSAGHKAGAETFRKITKYCRKIGIKYLTVYAFSTENWKRPNDEISFLMKLFEQYLNEALRDFQQENIKVQFLGDKSDFSQNLQKIILFSIFCFQPGQNLPPKVFLRAHRQESRSRLLSRTFAASIKKTLRKEC